MKISHDGATASLAPAAASAPGARLDTLARDVPATVTALLPAQSAAERDLVLRLMEIGFLPGEPVRVVARSLPGGDPIAVRVGQATFALRRHEAALVQVQVQAQQPEGVAA